MATRSATRRTAAAKPAPEPEVVEDDFEELEDDEETTTDEVEDDGDDLEELEEDEAVEETTTTTKTKTKAKSATPKAPAQPKIEFGSKELAAHVTEVTGETYDARAVRMLLRKLAKDEKFQRVVGEDRSRYNFKGPDDPAVQMVVDMVKSGAAKELKQAGLQAVKDKAEAKKAAAKAEKAKAAEAEAEEDDDMEEVEETPAPKRRATKTAAPAKATPATKRRTAQAK